MIPVNHAFKITYRGFTYRAEINVNQQKNRKRKSGNDVY